MPTPDTTAGAIMDISAALLNDVNKEVYSYSAQLPYLKLAFQELREMLEESNVRVTQQTTAFITVPANTSVISFITNPALPTNLISIQELWERPTGIDPYIPMTLVDYLPHDLDGVQIPNFLIWSWQNNSINLLPATQPNDLKLDYIAELSNIIDQNSTIGIINGQSFLEFRNAALCAKFVGENETRADALNIDAMLARDRLVNIENKSTQSIMIRHRPFRQSYKYKRSWGR